MKEIRYEVFTRHAGDCKHKAKGRSFKGCGCPKWLYEARTRRRVSAGTASWSRAVEIAREREESVNEAHQDDVAAISMVLADRAKAYVAGLKTSGKTREFWRKNELWLAERMPAFMARQNVINLQQLQTAHIEEWRSTWKDKHGIDSLLTMQKLSELISMFMIHCINNRWLTWNPCAALTSIKVPDPEPLFFTESEFARVESAVDEYALRQLGATRTRSQQRLRAFIHLLRWSGARITDACVMKRSSLEQHGRRWTLRFKMLKTDVMAVVPLPASMAEELLAVPNSNPTYFFWSGIGDPQTSSKNRWHAISHVFQYAGLKNPDGSPKRCKPHMFRHTFAVLSLQRGASLEDVQKALGHKSIKITQKHYAHWSRVREERLHEAFERTWDVVSIDSGRKLA